MIKNRNYLILFLIISLWISVNNQFTVMAQGLALIPTTQNAEPETAQNDGLVVKPRVLGTKPLKKVDPLASEKRAVKKNAGIEKLANYLKTPLPYLEKQATPLLLDKVTTDALKDLTLYTTLAEIKNSVKPFVYGNYFVFIHFDSTKLDRVFIAFEHEYYSQLHKFVKLKSNPNINVYLLPRTHIDQFINYRLVVNSVWMIDYSNPYTQIDSRGIIVSTASIPMIDPFFLPSIVKLDDNTLRFYLFLNHNYYVFRDTNNFQIHLDSVEYRAVYLTGSFTNWDPFLIQMQPVPEVDKLYYADIPLKEGVQYYYYQIGMTNILDPKNQSVSKRTYTESYVNSFNVISTVEDTTGATHLEVSTMGKN